jgi:hypothetical protein
MRLWSLGVLGFPAVLAAQTGHGPYARIAFLRPNDGQTVEFEAGYVRHLAWHKGAGETWSWYGWNITFGERQRWFVYASFGHSAGALDSAVAPGDDERDNVMNVAPHCQYTGSGLYEFLPRLSRGTGEPAATTRLELTTVDLAPGEDKTFEDALAAVQPSLRGETLWYRLVEGGPTPRYVRLRPRPTYAELLGEQGDQGLPHAVNLLIAKTSIEILSFRPTLSLGVATKTSSP